MSRGTTQPPELAVGPPPEAKPGLDIPWKPIGIGAGLVALLALVVFGLGFIGVGFGPPVNASQAFIKAVAAVETVKSYHFEGTGSVSLPTSPVGQPMSFKLTALADRADASTSQATFKFDLASVPVGVFPASFPTSLELEVRRLPEGVFIRAPILSSLLGSTEDKFFLFARPGAALNDAGQVATALGDGRRLGFEPVGPRSTAHYTFTLDPTNFANLIDVELTQNQALMNYLASQTITVDAWLGLSDHLPYRVRLTGTPTDGSVSGFDLDGQLSQFGEGVLVPAPSPNETFTEPLTGISLEKLAATLKLKARDGQRKADLAKIKTALELFKRDKGTYPSTKGAIVKSRDPSGAISSLVTAGLLTSLPIDPIDPDYWYGYTSADGSSYELWSIVEDADDPRGQLRDGFTVFVLKNDPANAPTSNDEAARLPISS